MITANHNQNSKLLWIIIGIISLVVILFFVSQWLLAKKDQPQNTAPSHQAIAKKTIPSSQPETALRPEATTAASEVATPSQLVEASIIQEPIPTNDSLAKEEIAKLDDIQQQLEDQRHDLKQQHHDADTLIKLKEDQIKLLEAQLQASKNS